jgi:hypothetical protein
MGARVAKADGIKDFMCPLVGGRSVLSMHSVTFIQNLLPGNFILQYIQAHFDAGQRYIPVLPQDVSIRVLGFQQKGSRVDVSILAARVRRVLF